MVLRNTCTCVTLHIPGAATRSVVIADSLDRTKLGPVFAEILSVWPPFWPHSLRSSYLCACMTCKSVEVHMCAHHVHGVMCTCTCAYTFCECTCQVPSPCVRALSHLSLHAFIRMHVHTCRFKLVCMYEASACMWSYMETHACAHVPLNANVNVYMCARTCVVSRCIDLVHECDACASV